MKPLPEHNRTNAAVATVKPTIAKIRVLLADSQPIRRLGMNQILALEEDISVVAHVGTLTDLYSVLDRYPVDVVMLEGALIFGPVPGIPKLVCQSPHAKLIVHMTSTEQASTVELYRSGIHGVVLRPIAPELLLRCIRKVSEGETWIDNASIGKIIDDFRSYTSSVLKPHTQPTLSPKEIAIVRCIACAMRNKEIAHQIGTTEQVVRNILTKIYEKLGVAGRLELALQCLHNEGLKAYIDESPPERPGPRSG